MNWARNHFGSDGPTWIDVSTGINPTPYPVPDLPAKVWSRLPETAQEEALLKVAREYYSVPNSAEIVACPGTQSALQLIPSLRQKSVIAIVSPTYAEHANCWKLAGHEVIEVPSLKEVPTAVDIVVVVSPNNPTGTIADKLELLSLQKDLSTKGGWLIVDEAFMDMNPSRSATHYLPQENSLILKSFGKFFGLAGLRLGFVLGDKTIVSQIRSKLGPWAVSGIASHIGKIAFEDEIWHQSTRKNLKSDSQRLSSLLMQTGLDVIGSTDLFILITTPDASSLFTHLCISRILTRPFPERPAHIRFGLPAGDKNWQRLEAALIEWKIRR
ncbi:MAG: threonine-phosphate decarboxylase [Sneathiella sp.]|nr:threonine-phosphate decarboxylase [Sneathiella sp.]